ncbi:MAG TPA: universal stress protein [Methylophilaceae bacterium]|nr:universal stress protein [Methylophilaceae bacterium]
MKRILVATDFSQQASRALRRAIALAAQHQARLDVMHVITPSSVDALCEMLPDSRILLEENLSNSATAQLYQVLDEVAPKQHLSIQPHVRISSIVDGIIEFADANDVDLIVLGSHGEHFAHELYLGTTAENVLTKCPRSVLVVRAAPDAPYGKVGVPVDFTPLSIAAVHQACELAADARITLLHAFQVPHHDRLRAMGVSEGEIKNARARFYDHASSAMDRLVAGISNERISSVLEMGYPPEMIRRWVEKFDFDLIVMGSHGNRLSSVMRYALHHSTGDVMIFRQLA